MKTADIIEALKKRHRDYNEWALFIELRVGTGYRKYRVDGQVIDPEQRIDAWAINLYPSKFHHRIAYEIKVSRSDFLHELKHPEKRQSALLLSNQFYFVTPKGLVKKEEIPEEAGLIEVNENINSRVTIEAPIRKSIEPSWNFLCSISRRVQKNEKGMI